MKIMGRKSDFVGNSIAKSATCYFVIIFDFIFTHFLETKIFEKTILCLQKIFFK